MGSVSFIAKFSGILLLFLNPFELFAQEKETPIRRTVENIIVDGILDEAVWQEATLINNFQQHYPENIGPAKNKTEVRLLFDQRFLYISARCFQATENGFVVQSLKRDYDFWENDAFDIYLDAFGDATSGLVFGVNPFGVQRDGIIPNGGIKAVDATWDTRWFAEVSRQTDGWTVEIAIPFKSLRFKRRQDSWRINFARNALRQNEISTWAPVSRGFSINTLSLMGQLLWENPPPTIHQNVGLVPYLAFKTEKESESKATVQPLVGADAKIGFNSSLHLDLTINPDFSQVEVDQQVINLKRFELFFPEKRLFFLENSDLFSNLGNSRIRPFFSRRIGSLNQEPIPILFGARLSGKLGKTWKIGLMDAQTKTSGPEQSDGQNYLVATVQKSFFSGSSLTAFLSNRQMATDWSVEANNFSRIGGLEFDYRSKDSKWAGKSFAHYSLYPGNPGDAMAFSAKMRYRTKAFSFFAGIDAVGENYLPDIGFVPRLYHHDEERDTSFRIPYIEQRTNGYYRFFPSNNSRVDFVGTEVRLSLYTDQQLEYQEHLFQWNFLVNFIDQSRLTFSFSDYAPTLFFPFTLDGLDLAFKAGNYPNQEYTLAFETGKRQALFGQAKLAYSGEFLGRRLSTFGELNYRYFQYLVLGLNFSYQRLHHFPEQYGAADFTLIGSQLELSFSRRFFLTTFLQYNTQSQNFNINGRFNWRFQPLSDLYIVYTSNYLTEGFSQKDRALVLKFSYWLNL